MNPSPAIETRVGALVSAYADRAPVDVDPVATARLVVGGAARRRARPGALSLIDRGPALVFLVVALLVAIAAGALVAGRQPSRDDLRMLTDRAFVEPFTGLPPDGAAPSTPETGELVFSFGGRVDSLRLDFHRMWVYADGRLIWKSNLEGSTREAWRWRFGASEPTTAVIEQRLTPDGVERLRSHVMSTAIVRRAAYRAGDDPTDWGRPGVLWGGLTVRVEDGTFTATWTDSGLPGRLADPGSWLPAGAWADQRIGAYVPSRYAVCLQHDVPEGSIRLAPTDIWDRLPEPTRTLIRSKAIQLPDPDWNEQDPRCLYQVSTDDARAISEAFEDAGLHGDPRGALGYRIPIGLPSSTGEGLVQLLVVLPNGEVVCHCG